MAPLVCHPADSLTAEAGPAHQGALCTRTPEELPVWHTARGTRRGAGGYFSVYPLKPRAHRRSRKNPKLLNTRLAQVPTTVDAGGERQHQLFEERGRTSRTNWSETYNHVCQRCNGVNGLVLQRRSLTRGALHTWTPFNWQESQ